MKRLSYISRESRSLSPLDIANIEVLSTFNNKKNEISGILIFFDEFIFQILEGPDEKVNHLFNDLIKEDERHSNILKLEDRPIEERQFKDWGLETIQLDRDDSNILMPIRKMITQLAHVVTQLNDSYSVISTYASNELLDLLQQNINPITTTPKRNEKVIMFVDLVGFTTVTRHLSLAETSDILNRYFSVVDENARKYKGTVNKFMGDGCMILFDTADQAVAAGISIVNEVDKLTDSFPDLAKPLITSIGIAQGEILYGNFGSDHHKDFTAVGDAVNRAARIEQLTRIYHQSLLVDEKVKTSAGNKWNVKEIDEVTLRGFNSASKLYTLSYSPQMTSVLS